MTVKEDKIELEGEIIEALRNGMFKIALDNGHVTTGYISGTAETRESRSPGPALIGGSQADRSASVGAPWR
jgi:hypothetical protein